MSVAALPLGGVATARRPVVVLAGLEARRYATRVSVWAGWAATVALAIWHRSPWPGGAYVDVVPLAFAPLALGVYVAAVRIGGRDGEPAGGGVADAAPLGPTERAAARLLGLAAPVLLTALTVLGVAVVSRVEGGFWLGEGARRTDTATHTPAELLQPVLLVALAGALGVAAGRTIRHTVIAVAIGVFVWTALFPASWVWNGPVFYPVAPVQTMPMAIRLPDVRRLTDTPVGWFVEAPTRYQRDFTHQRVHLPTVAFHDVYLVGLLLCASAGAARRTTVVRLGGLAVAVAAVLAQVAVSPV